jgi:hypothetical protein
MADTVLSEVQDKEVVAVMGYALRPSIKDGTCLLRREWQMYSPTTCPCSGKNCRCVCVCVCASVCACVSINITLNSV